MSSLASVLVANAKATPENVVPYPCQISKIVSRIPRTNATYEINADDQLCFTSARGFDLDSRTRSVIRLRALWHGRLRGLILLLLAAITSLLRIARRAWRGCLAVNLLRRVARGLGCSVYGWWRHRTVRATLMLLLRGTKLAWGSVSVGRRSSELIGIVHRASWSSGGASGSWGTGGQRGG